MTSSIRRFLSILFVFIIIFTGTLPAESFADADMRRVVVGADLNSDQIAAVYEIFGIQRGEVPELRLTNIEEHAAVLWFPCFLCPYGCCPYEPVCKGSGLGRVGSQAYKRGAGEYLQLFFLFFSCVPEEKTGGREKQWIKYP